MTNRPPSSSSSFDHSYELPLRRNLLLVLDLLDILRFIAGVLLDRLGVAPCHGGVRLPGLSWGEELVDVAAAELILEAALRAHRPSGSGIGSGRALYNRRAPIAQPRVDDRGTTTDSSAARDDEGVAICSICLTGLEAGGCQVAELCSCSHAFHAACVDAWVSSGEATTCPLCRAPVSPTAWDGPWPGVGATPRAP